MNKSQLDASTYGLGELITQRKLFSVPDHQRSYSWGVEQVDQLLSDVRYAFEKNSPEYFVGLIVLQGPVDGAWQILDGQQRLATSTMIYSAIREWLQARNFGDDARQIETEFIGVRQLGGTFTPRLSLNTNNRDIFEQYVNTSSPLSDLRAAAKTHHKHGSGRRILEAAIHTRMWIEKFCNESAADKNDQARILF
ncbi:MAG: DUF262 domain-containing protein, partial [Verrucomicrobiaceae bacterium]